MISDSRNTHRWNDRLHWALILLWAGLVLGLDGLGLLPQAENADVWNWIFLGAGLLALGRLAVRTLSDGLTDPDASDVGLALALTVLGVSGFVTFWIVCSAALIAAGAILLATSARATGSLDERHI